MNRSFLTGLLLIVCTRLFAFPGDIDSLKKKLNTASNDTVKASLYTQLAQQYMKYVAVQDQHLKERYQEIAINYTLAAIHQYSRLDDSTGLRVSYDDLSKIYYDQKKYTQAKWFILQSNTLARQQNDVTNIIASLITLAHIKMDIHDYDLAKGDLKEALSLSAQNCFSGQQSQVLYTIASLYNKTNNKAKAQAFLRRYTFMRDSIRRDSQMRRLAKLQLRKKKFYVINNILRYRNNTQTILL